MKRLLGCLVAVVICLCVFVVPAFADDVQTIAIEYSADDEPIVNACFKLYYIGDISGTSIVPDSTFADYSVSFNISDADSLSTLAMTLSAYLQRDNVSADFTDYTDEEGIADFGGASFASGAYLYIGEKHTQNGYIFFCEPVIVIVEDGSGVVSKVKYEYVDETTTMTVTYKVFKFWSGDEENSRPVQIEVQLLRDGDVFDTVILDENNNWRYQWTDLSCRYQWTVTEKIVPDYYVVALSKNKQMFMVENSVTVENTTVPDETTTNDETTANQDTTTNEETTTTSVTTTSPETTTVSSGGEGGLPQSGALKWPVPYLACMGLILLIAGYVTYRKSEFSDEQT